MSRNFKFSSKSNTSEVTKHCHSEHMKAYCLKSVVSLQGWTSWQDLTLTRKVLFSTLKIKSPAEGKNMHRELFATFHCKSIKFLKIIVFKKVFSWMSKHSNTERKGTKVVKTFIRIYCSAKYFVTKIIEYSFSLCD